jgi:hypothetical protein
MIRIFSAPQRACSKVVKRTALLVFSALFLLFCTVAQICIAQEEPDVNGIPGYLGMSMKGNWRPYNNNSPWNTIIPAGVEDHVQSPAIIDDMIDKGITLRFAGTWTTTLHVVNRKASKYQYHSSTNIYRFTHFNPQNCWNPDTGGDDVTDDPWPYIPGVTYTEDMADGRMIIIDKSAGSKYTAYEITHGTNTANLVGGYAPCSTFNIWNLGYRGYVYYRPPCSTGTPSVSGNECASCDDYWPVAGGSGAGTPLLGGLLRPEELDNAVGAVLAPTDPNYNPDVPSGDWLIHHALSFCYNFNRCGPPLYPVAYRADGNPVENGIERPVQGMLFQLVDPNNTLENSISNSWGKVVVRTLKKYGMYLVDGGSNNETAALYLQNMYTPNVERNIDWWNRNYPGLFSSITGIHVTHENFRVVNTESQFFHDARPLPEHSECDN